MSGQKYKVECLPHRRVGGQHVGIAPQTIIVTHEDTKQLVGVSTVGRSQHEAKELAITLLDMILDDIK